MERQKHGFNYEQRCKEKYGIQLSEEYTSKWDGELNGFPVSIKIEKYGTDIELADFFRNLNIEQDFYLIVGFWDKEKDNIKEEFILFIKAEEYKQLFNKEFETILHNLLANITNNKEDDVKWKEKITSLRKEWANTTPNLIRLRFKRDHKTQKRIQCAINNKDFYNYFLPKYEVKNNEWRNQEFGAKRCS